MLFLLFPAGAVTLFHQGLESHRSNHRELCRTQRSVPGSTKLGMQFQWLLLRRLSLKVFIDICAATGKLFLRFTVVSMCVSNVSDGCSKLIC